MMSGRVRVLGWILVVLATVALAMYALGTIAIPVRLHYDDGYGNVYSGRAARGDFTGAVRIEYADGAVWEGPLKNGQFDGRGRYVSPDGWTFTGEFKDGAVSGAGRFSFQDGSYEISE
jgi:hypothetical protein